MVAVSQFRCHACDAPITLLSSQKNGNLDTCLNCAIEQAAKLRYVFKRRDQVISDEILCQRHYQADKAVLLQPLTEREKQAGLTQSVTPYSGPHTCVTCMDEDENESPAPRIVEDGRKAETKGTAA